MCCKLAAGVQGRELDLCCGKCAVMSSDTAHRDIFVGDRRAGSPQPTVTSSPWEKFFPLG